MRGGYVCEQDVEAALHGGQLVHRLRLGWRNNQGRLACFIRSRVQLVYVNRYTYNKANRLHHCEPTLQPLYFSSNVHVHHPLNVILQL